MGTSYRRFRVWIISLFLLLGGLEVLAQPLTQLQFDIVGMRLQVDPPVLTVPKDIATQVNTQLVVPASSSAETAAAIAALQAETVLEAELRGPSIPPVTLRVQPGQPIPIPPLALPGDYFLDQIRLVKNGQTLLDATPNVVPIKVISQVLVTSVTSRPLSLDEVQQKGIVIDQNNFQVMNFQVAFNIDSSGATFKIDLPVALPTTEFLAFQKDPETVVKSLAVINQTLAATQKVTLPPEFENRPGLNFSVAALPFIPVEEQEGGRGFGPPPLTGLVVIPGNIAFLNQFFSVQLIVANVAPDGTSLVVRDVQATISLPLGENRVANASNPQCDNPQPSAQCDDPLRLARLAGVGQQPTVQVVQVGPDGLLGTADDLPTIPPQRTGEGEFLVEGLREGAHTIDFEIRAVLDGLPSGPVQLMGKAMGAVFVRNPTFSVTLSHPRSVHSGDAYDLYTTVTNTSQSPANLVSVSLDARSISGAQLISAETMQFETIAPGQSVTAKFSLIAQQTGEVNFTSFTADPGVSGHIQLRTSVGARGFPVAPNAIVLPETTRHLPASLVDAAQRVLGQAFSVATAPAGALPPEVRFIRYQTVIDRGVELAEAGQRRQFDEPLARTIQDLLLDWLGNRTADDGFDQLLRTTNAGRHFLAEVARILNDSVVPSTVLNYQQSFAQTTVPRTPHLSAIVGLGGGPAPVRLTIMDVPGQVVGQSDTGIIQSLPYAGLFNLQNDSGRADLALVSRLNATRYTVEVTGTGSGSFDLGLVLPAGNGQFIQLRYSGVAIQTGGTARVVIDLNGANVFALQVDQDGDGRTDQSVTPATVNIVEGIPQVVAVRQIESKPASMPGNPLNHPGPHGLLIGVLFDKPVTEESAETKAHYTLEANNAVTGAQLQPSGRLVYLYLHKPVGALIPRTLSLANIADARNTLLVPVTRPIHTALADGGHVFGQVRTADGQPVPDAVLRLDVTFYDDASQQVLNFTVSTIRTDRQGGYDFDYVTRQGNALILTAQHPVTLEFTELIAKVRAPGAQLVLNPTFRGRGLVRGRVLAANGVTPVPGALVSLTPSVSQDVSFGQSKRLRANANGLGEYVITDVPVGTYTVRSNDAAGAFGQATGLLATAGDDVTTDIVLISQPQEAGKLIGRVFLSDGSTPAINFTVYVGAQSRNSFGVSSIAAVDQTTTDTAGSFAFTGLLAKQYDVVAVDAASQQVGTSSALVLAQTTVSVNLVMEALGTVEGVVFNAQHQPVAGALVAGGPALVTTDVHGFFRIENVPAGRPLIEAGDPVSKRRGSALVTVFPGQTAQVAITLEARATIIGRVFDANGVPVPKATVRLPTGGGYTFVFANNNGFFRFPDLPLGEYLIQAPGPSQAFLIDWMQELGIDPRVAFTMGDIPPELGGDPPPTAADIDAVLAAYRAALQLFFSVPDAQQAGPPSPAGGFGWNKVKLFQDNTTVSANLHYLPQGTVSGTTLDASAQPAAALVRILSVAPDDAGMPTFQELRRLTSDVQTGAFSFSSIAHFDLPTFQTAGIRTGDFTLEAANPFSPAVVRLSGQLNVTNPNQAGIALQFPPAAATNGTITGIVFMPDGVTPAPAGTQVHISFGDLTVTTDAQGQFQNRFPIPAGGYTLTAEDPISGLQGQVHASVPAGGNVDVPLRLLGPGAVTVTVKRPTGQIVPHANITLAWFGFPGGTADGVTNVNGAVRFVNITEGLFSVMAEEQITGLTGRASGTVVRDSEVSVTVTITASGRVTGTFVAADGRTPVPNAQIVLQAGGIQAFAPTDTHGRFELVAIPVGQFIVEGSDPLTGRLGRTLGALRFEGDVVDVTIVPLPRGTVQGVVLNADGVTPLPGAPIAIEVSSFMPTRLQATTRNDGSFRFDGVSAGTFTLMASARPLALADPLSRFGGQATGTLTFESQVVNQNVLIEGFGALHVTVLDADGTPADNTEVNLFGPGEGRATVDANGEFTFALLKLGTYQLSARSLANAHNGGNTTALVAVANETAAASITLRGVGNVVARVVASDSTTPVPSARVELNAKAASANEPPSAFAGNFLAFTNAAGIATFPGIPRGDFFVKAEAGPLAGVSTGTLTTPDETVPVTVQLGASGSISGRVLLPDGMTAAAQAIVTLQFQPQSAQQSGVLQVNTGLLGTFAFGGVPLGAVKVAAFERVSNGVRTATGTLTFDGQQLDLGDLVLDNTTPRVIGVTPANGTTGVPVSSAIVLTFSEPMQPSSFSIQPGAGNLQVLAGTTSLQGSLSFANSNQMVTFTPSQPLTSSTLYTVMVKGGVPNSPQDASGLPLLVPFVSSFTVQDTLPPALVSVSPAANALQVLPEAVVRVTFSEAITPAFTMTLHAADGQEVAGRVERTLGDTVAIFTPTNVLLPNTTYTVVVAGATDVAGNPLAGGPFTAQFSTVDTIAPLLNFPPLQGPAIAGTSVTVQPNITGNDVARVEYRFSSQTPQVVNTSPFALNLLLPVNQTSLEVTAVAVDQVGNRSAPASLAIPIAVNQPPTVTLTNSSGETLVAQGQTLTLNVTATDDVALTQLLFSATGAVNQSSTTPVPGGQAQLMTSLSLTVPPTAAAGGSLTLQAAALDSVGNRSLPATLILQVRDGARPTVAITSPVNNAQVIPGQTVEAMVTASDDVALSTVTLTCTLGVSGCGTRALSPAASSSIQTFTLGIPTTLVAPATVILTASATDTSGNSSLLASKTLHIADTVAPTLIALQALSGSTRVLPGQSVTVQARASDNVAVAAVAFHTTGALTQSQVIAVTPPATPATAHFPFTVPAGAANGSSITVQAQARDAAGNTSAQATLTLQVGDTVPPTATLVAPPENSQVTPGQNLILTVQASDDVAVRQIAFTASGVLSGGEVQTISPAVTPATVSFTLPVPVETPPGALTLSVTAQDTAGNASATVSRNVTVLDTAAPSVHITSPAAGTAVDPRHPLSVSVTATDNGGVTEISLTTSGATVFTETRSVSPAAPTRTETFSIAFATLPPTGGALILNASARDAAEHIAMASPVTVTVQDVVPPALAHVTPADAATQVDPRTTVSVQFTEAVARNTVTPATLSLHAGSTAVPVSFTFSGGDQIVTLTPVTPPLALHTLFTLRIGTGLTDVAGNAFAADVSTTFTTASPDLIPPKVASVVPANNATEISISTAIHVTFTEPIAPGTISTTSFPAMSSAGTVSGSFSVFGNNMEVRFTPEQPLPFATLITFQLTSAITDVAGNALADTAGNPLTQPLTFTFTTGTFSITSPADGSDVVENTPILLEARASAALNIATVTFTVNGQALTPVPNAGGSFTSPLTTPAAATTSQLTITATAHTSSGNQVAQDQAVVNVVTGLRLEPPLLGVPLGGTASVRLSLSSPAATELAINLSAVHPAVVTLPINPVILPAGQLERSIIIAGVAAGNTTMRADSSRGTASVIVAVSQPEAQQQQVGRAAMVGAALLPPLSLGEIILPEGGQQTLTVRPSDTPVLVTSSNAAVVSVQPAMLPAGATPALLTLTSGGAGEATITLRGATGVRQLTVLVGTPPAGHVPAVLAVPAGFTVLPPVSIGEIVLPVSGQQTLTVRPSDTPVLVTSSNAAVVSVQPAMLPAGAIPALLTLTTGGAGEATITLRGATGVRQLTVLVGTPPAGHVPAVLAVPAGFTVLPPRPVGTLYLDVGVSRSLTLQLLSAPATVATMIQASSADPQVASITPTTLMLPAGQQDAAFTVRTGNTDAETLITLHIGTEVHALLVVVGVPSAQQIPSTLAPSVGVGVK